MRGDRRWVGVLAVAVAAVGAGVWFGRGVALPPAAPTMVSSWATTVADTTLDQITVHVAGWVEAPGVVLLAGGARVGDAVAAAGGARPGAALANLNLAQPLSDGQQVVVPGPDSASAPGPTSSGVGETGDGLVHVNTAGVDELDRLPGVGPVLAERIVSHREEMGPFETVEDLLDVSGIGEAKLASLRDLVAVP